MDIVICAFNGEEEGLCGSRAFVNELKSIYKSLYNINIDSIGAKAGGKLANAISDFVVTNNGIIFETND